MSSEHCLGSLATNGRCGCVADTRAKLVLSSVTKRVNYTNPQPVRGVSYCMHTTPPVAR